MFPYIVCLYIPYVPFGVKIDTFLTLPASEPNHLPACMICFCCAAMAYKITALTLFYTNSDVI